MSVKVKFVFYIFVFAVVLFSALLYLTMPLQVPVDTPKWNDLPGDGARLFQSAVPQEKIQKWRELSKSKKYKELKTEMSTDANIQRLVKSISPEYVLQDYIWVIEKSAVHTCHRDNNGTFFNTGQKYESYTMLVYLESMDKCLGVIPGSHMSQYTNAVNLMGGVKDIVCSAGDVIIFNANLVHVGTLTEKDDNLRVQMKISHPDDLEVLKYYQNFNKVLNKENNNPRILRQMQRGFTCAFPFLSDLTQSENIKTARGTVDGAEISSGQKWFSWLFYGRTDFYDLPNAF
jgi:hypothetical protein